MHLTTLFCASAQAGEDGRLNVRGVFSELYAAGFPARQELMTLLVLIEWDRKRSGRVPFRIDLADPGGQAVFSIEGHTDVEERAAGRAPARTELVLPLQQTVFPEPGRYRVALDIDGEQTAGCSLHVLSREE